MDIKNGQFGEPYRLPDIINGGSSIFSPAIAADGSLYFMRPLADTGRFHIYRAAWRDGRYAAPELVAFSAPGSFGDVDPAVAPDESFLVLVRTDRWPPATSCLSSIGRMENGAFLSCSAIRSTAGRPMWRRG
ncbi:hypothetical protein ACQ86N_16615 [Puia sp. P3]|uniref:hypothetical protein n=1 Tax=Puia sp. P3 TaxID=3423952 RepID=UPI003D66D8BB